MSGALQGVLGGSGGLLGGIMNIASMMFPPLQLAAGLGNMLTSAIGSAINGAVDQMTQQGGLPKFVGNMVKDIVSKLMPGMHQPVDKGCSDHLQDQVGDKFQKFENELMKEIKDTFERYLGEAQKNGQCGGKGGKGGKGGAEGAGGAAGGGNGSWFVALAKALGEVENKQAEKVKKLAGEVADSLGAGDKSDGAQKAQFDKMEELKGEAKVQDAFTNTVKSVLESIGNALTTAARSQ